MFCFFAYNYNNANGDLIILNVVTKENKVLVLTKKRVDFSLTEGERKFLRCLRWGVGACPPLLVHGEQCARYFRNRCMLCVGEGGAERDGQTLTFIDVWVGGRGVKTGLRRIDE